MIEIILERDSALRNVRFGVLLSSHQALIARVPLGQMPASPNRLKPITPCLLMPAKPSICESLPATRTRLHSATRPPGSSNLARLLDLPQPRRLRSPSARSSGTTSAGFQPKLLAPFRSRSSTPSPRWFATPIEWGEKEAHNFLQQFVLEQMRVPDWPHYPMTDLRKLTPPPLPPTSTA